MAEIIRNEIRRSKKTRYRIAQETGVSECQLHNLMKGKTLAAETLGVLLDYFGFKLVKGKQRRKS